MYESVAGQNENFHSTLLNDQIFTRTQLRKGGLIMAEILQVEHVSKVYGEKENQVWAQ